MSGGVINVLKPPGMTSHDVVAFIRRVYSLKRVGHAGTLDPAAAGVLPVFLGQATRLIEYFADDSKSYRAELTLGLETDTGDDTGRVIRTGAALLPPVAEIEKILSGFKGAGAQIPPMYSAVKIAGKKMYELAREGIEVERRPRPITIHSISLVNAEKNHLLFDVDCSKGTYIRVLCADIGSKMGCPAVMSFLVRTRVGSCLLADACTLEDIASSPATVLTPADKLLDCLPVLTMTDAQLNELRHGRPFVCQPPVSPEQAGVVRLYYAGQYFAGIGRIEVLQEGGCRLKPLKVMLEAVAAEHSLTEQG